MLLSSEQKILIVLPYWRGDQPAANRVARLIADLQPSSGTSLLADFLFVCRNDCSHDPATVSYVSRKFRTWTCISDRKETGWPHGCNGTFLGALTWYYRGVMVPKSSPKRLPRYKALFICEADCVPLTWDAISFLHREWDRVSGRSVIAGALIPAGPHGHAHINGGCCLLSPDPKFLDWVCVRAGGNMQIKGGGWDWVMANEFKRRGWADIPGIKSYWRTPSITKDRLKAEIDSGLVWLHGVKDGSCEKHARELLFQPA